MLTVVDDVLKCESAAYRLRYACESCAHFDEERRACAEGYPNEAHLGDPARTSPTLRFCKSFELA